MRSLDRRRQEWLVAALFFALGVPSLVFSYLPCVDYPQHLAIVSVLKNLHDPTFEFDRWFTVEAWRSLYWLPYGLAWLLSHVLGLQLAMKAVVFLSLLAYPAGLLAMLRALERPAYLALLGVPLVYNRAFYWGFINFNLGVGLALLSFAAFVQAGTADRRVARWVCALSLTASVLTHVYGLALFAGLVGLWAVTGGLLEVRRRAVLLVPAALGVVAWAWMTSRARGFGQPSDPPLIARLVRWPNALNGGFVDGSDNALAALGLVLAVVAWLCHRREAGSRVGLTRVFALAFAGNELLYLVLPEHAHAAKFVHFRHAFLGVMFVPLLIEGTSRVRHFWLAPAALALLTLLNAWRHLDAFDREASSFDPILAHVPPRSRGVGLNFARGSAVVKGPVYQHFVSLIQAQKGGYTAMSFAQLFWNIPVRARGVVPDTPLDLEALPSLFDDRATGRFYDWALVRLPEKRLAPTEAFPFELTAVSPPWQLYLRRAAP